MSEVEMFPQVFDICKALLVCSAFIERAENP
jgi:hypothetical protein